MILTVAKNGTVPLDEELKLDNAGQPIVPVIALKSGFRTDKLTPNGVAVAKNLRQSLFNVRLMRRHDEHGAGADPLADFATVTVRRDSDPGIEGGVGFRKWDPEFGSLLPILER